MKLAIFFLLLLFFSSCSFFSKPGTEENPLKFYFTPSVDRVVIQSESAKMLKFLEDETGLHFESIIPETFEDVIEAFGSKDADLSLMNSFGYVKANESYGSKAGLTSIRHGKDSYQGQIIANAFSGIESIADLNGKKVAFTSKSSTSGYIYPKHAMDKLNVIPASTEFAGQHDKVVKMVYFRSADAGATYYAPPKEDGTIQDARYRFLELYPDIIYKVKVIHVTDPIPNDPVVFRKDIDQNLIDITCKALIEFANTKEGTQVLEALYSIEGFKKADDSFYDQFKEIVQQRTGE